MKKRSKIITLLCVLALGAMVLTGCVQDVDPDPGETKPVVNSFEVNRYFVNSEYVETGDESLEHLFVDESTIEASEGENPYIILLESLANVPNDSMGTVVTEDIVFNDVYLSEEDNGETIVVDLASEGIYGHGGSLSESLFIKQIVGTLLDNSTISGTDRAPTKVQFLVDGEIVESLMGHISATEPFTDFR